MSLAPHDFRRLGLSPGRMSWISRRVLALPTLLALLAGCMEAQPTTPASTPSPDPPGCLGTFAFVMTTPGIKSANLHLVDACEADPLRVPDEAGPELDAWIDCDSADPATFPAWSPDGSHLLYVSNYYYSGHGEVHVMDVATHAVRELVPSFALLDAATGRVVKETCAEPEECHFAEIVGGQVTFINSKNPRWSPDGAQIAFDSMHLGDSPPDNIAYRHFVMGSDGANIRALTDQEAADLDAAWAARQTPIPASPSLSTRVETEGVTVSCVTWRP